MLFNEIKGGSSTPARELIVATSQITLIRSIGDRNPRAATSAPKRDV